MSSSEALSEAHAVPVRLTAAEQIRTAIVAGQLAPGQRLPDRMLGELTGVGRTTVREAVRQLEAEGLVTVVPHRGPMVAELSEAETRDLYELRAMLEGQAGRLCAQRGGAAHAAALLRSVDTLEQAWLRGHISGVMAANADFYAALLGGARNEALRQALGSIHNRLALYRFSSTRWPGRTAQSVVELRAIGQAIVDRDAAASEAACIRHIEAAAELALLLLAERARGAAQERRRRVAAHKGD